MIVFIRYTAIQSIAASPYTRSVQLRQDMTTTTVGCEVVVLLDAELRRQATSAVVRDVQSNDRCVVVGRYRSRQESDCVMLLTQLLDTPHPV